ncbi:flavoprotein [Streptomyces olivoreticuli]
MADENEDMRVLPDVAQAIEGVVAGVGRTVWTARMTDARVLYLIACAAPPALHIRTGIEKAQAAGWDVCLVVSPSARRWIDKDMADLERLTGHVVRSAYKLPEEVDVLPSADAMLVAPATFNTVNKWAAGISDTLALGLITEAIGLRVPLVALPYLNQAQAAHPQFGRSVSFLRECGVTVLLGGEGFVPHVPKHGDLTSYPWDAALRALPNGSDVPSRSEEIEASYRRSTP